MYITPLHFIVQMVAGWANRRQQAVIAYLLEENKVLREQLGDRQLRFTNRQRIRLARAAKGVGRKALLLLNRLVTPDTLLRWYRELIAKKYDGSKGRSIPDPTASDGMKALVIRMATENPTWGYRRIVGAPVFTAEVRRFLADAGVKPIKLPPNSPNLNAYAERFVGSVRRECLDRIIPLGEQHLRQVLREYVENDYLAERLHQSLTNNHIAPRMAPGQRQWRDRV